MPCIESRAAAASDVLRRESSARRTDTATSYCKVAGCDIREEETGRYGRRNVIDLVAFANGATMVVGPRSVDAFSAWRVRLCLRAAKAALFP